MADEKKDKKASKKTPRKSSTKKTAKEPSKKTKSKTNAKQAASKATHKSSPKATKSERKEKKTVPAAAAPVVVRASARYVRIPPRKARLIADQVRGLHIEKARALLQFSPRGAAKDI